MLVIYERVLGPFRARKHEFIYDDGYPLREGRMVWLVYTKEDKQEMFIDYKDTPLFPRSPKDKTLFSRYADAKKDIQREIYLSAFKPIITKATRKKGNIQRAFATYLLDEDKSIFEINPVDVGTGNFYNYVTFNWQISGVKENVKNDNILSLNVAEKELPGMLNFLNPLEFYKEEEVELTPKEITMKKLERLLHNPHGYGSHSEASNIGNALGLSGAHQMPDGTWMPGSTHAEYLNAMNNRTIQTPAGNIPTQNLRRNSGY